MPKTTRVIPAKAKSRPQRRRKSKQYKSGSNSRSTSSIKKMLIFRDGEKGLSKVVKNLTPPPKNPDISDDRRYIRELMPFHRAIAEARRVGNLSVTQLARKFKVSRSHMGKIVASPLFKEYEHKVGQGIEEVIQDVMGDIKRMSIPAIEVVDGEVHSEANTLEERKLRLSAAKDVLDRAGFTRKPLPQAGSRTMNVNLVQLNQMSKEEVYKYADSLLRDMRNT